MNRISRIRGSCACLIFLVATGTSWGQMLPPVDLPRLPPVDLPGPTVEGSRLPPPQLPSQGYDVSRLPPSFLPRPVVDGSRQALPEVPKVTPGSVVLVREGDGPERQAHLFWSWRTPEGSWAHRGPLVQTKEMLTIVERKSTSGRGQSASVQIYHWGRATCRRPMPRCLCPPASARRLEACWRIRGHGRCLRGLPCRLPHLPHLRSRMSRPRCPSQATRQCRWSSTLGNQDAPWKEAVALCRAAPAAWNTIPNSLRALPSSRVAVCRCPRRPRHLLMGITQPSGILIRERSSLENSLSRSLGGNLFLRHPFPLSVETGRQVPEGQAGSQTTKTP